MLFVQVDALRGRAFIYKVSCAIGTVDFSVFLDFSVTLIAESKLRASVTIS
jgi:hypothetical protein